MRGRSKEKIITVRMRMKPKTEGSSQIQRAFFVQPDVSDKQDAKKNEHRRERKSGQMMRQPRTEQDRPGKEKDGFHVEDHKEHADDVEARGVPSAGAGLRKDAALVGLKFSGAASGARANVFEDAEGDDGKRKNQQGEEEQRDVGGWNWMASGRMLAQISASWSFGDPI